MHEHFSSLIKIFSYSSCIYSYSAQNSHSYTTQFSPPFCQSIKKGMAIHKIGEKQVITSKIQARKHILNKSFIYLFFFKHRFTNIYSSYGVHKFRYPRRFSYDQYDSLFLRSVIFS